MKKYILLTIGIVLFLAGCATSPFESDTQKMHRIGKQADDWYISQLRDEVAQGELTQEQADSKWKSWLVTKRSSEQEAYWQWKSDEIDYERQKKLSQIQEQSQQQALDEAREEGAADGEAMLESWHK